MSHPPKYRCLKCGDILTGWSDATCCPRPLCGGELRILEEYAIFVKDTGHDYLARHGRVIASCTAGPRMAAESLARKLFGDRTYSMKAVNRDIYIATEEG